MQASDGASSTATERRRGPALNEDKSTEIKMKLKTILATWALALSCPTHLLAVMANPNPIELEQPDGIKIILRVHGDEHFHWHEDMDGFTVVHHNGQYVYAKRDARGALVPTGLKVGSADPKASGLHKGALPSRQMIDQQQAAWSNAAAPEQVVSVGGTLKNLVILCMFRDHTLGIHTRAPSDYEVLFNKTGGDPVLAPSGSVRDFYREISYGMMTIDSTVVAWVTLPNSEEYYANGQTGFGAYPQNAQRMVEDALELVDRLVDFGQFDADNDGYVDSLTVIHSSYGAETGGGGGNWIWSHRWGLPLP
jgi:hypothetical protein